MSTERKDGVAAEVGASGARTLDDAGELARALDVAFALCGDAAYLQLHRRDFVSDGLVYFADIRGVGTDHLIAQGTGNNATNALRACVLAAHAQHAGAGRMSDERDRMPRLWMDACTGDGT